MALSYNGATIAIKELRERNIHASFITLFIDEVMKQAGKTYADLQAIAVAKGPGSYTGLRIGVSTAKGLCFALDIPLIATNTLEMMVAGFLAAHEGFDGYVVPMLDARRMEVYTGIWNNNGLSIEETSAKIIDDQFMSDYLLNHTVAFIGDGSDKLADILQNPNAHFFLNEDFNSAKNLSKLAYNAYSEKQFENLAYFEPFYLKDFVVTKSTKKLL